MGGLVTALLHLLLAAVAAGLALLVRPGLAAAVAGQRGTVQPWAELKRLWRKQGVGTGRLAAFVPALVLGCDGLALLLVPTVPWAGPEPFGNLLVVFGLLAAGRLALGLAAFHAGGAPAGAAGSRALLFLAAAGPAAALVAGVAGGVAGSVNVGLTVAGLREAVGMAVPAALAAAAAAVLGWADLSTAPSPGLFAAGRALAVLRVAVAMRCAAWLDLVAVLLPPAAPDMAGQAVLAWAVKVVVLVAALAARDGWPGLDERAEMRPLAGPALAALLALAGAMLAALRGAAA